MFKENKIGLGRFRCIMQQWECKVLQPLSCHLGRCDRWHVAAAAPRPRARAASQVAVAGISSVVRTSASSEHQHQ